MKVIVFIASFISICIAGNLPFYKEVNKVEQDVVIPRPYLDTTFIVKINGFVDSNANTIFEMLGGEVGADSDTVELEWPLSDFLKISCVTIDSMNVAEYKGVYRNLLFEQVESNSIVSCESFKWHYEYAPKETGNKCNLYGLGKQFCKPPGQDIYHDYQYARRDIYYGEYDSNKSGTKGWYKFKIDSLYTHEEYDGLKTVVHLDSFSIRFAIDSLGNGAFKTYGDIFYLDFDFNNYNDTVITLGESVASQSIGKSAGGLYSIKPAKEYDVLTVGVISNWGKILTLSYDVPEGPQRIGTSYSIITKCKGDNKRAYYREKVAGVIGKEIPYKDMYDKEKENSSYYNGSFTPINNYNDYTSNQFELFEYVFTQRIVWEDCWTRSPISNYVSYTKNESGHTLRVEVDSLYMTHIQVDEPEIEFEYDQLDSVKIRFSTDSAGNGKFNFETTPVNLDVISGRKQMLRVLKNMLILPTDLSNSAIKVSNLQGREVYSQTHVGSVVDLNCLSAGVYTILIQGKKGRMVDKILLK